MKELAMRLIRLYEKRDELAEKVKDLREEIKQNNTDIDSLARALILAVYERGVE